MSKKIHDVIIIGGGIAAHTSAIYTARASLNPLIISSIEPDQLSLTNEVENFPGFPKGVLGPELVKNAKEQAKRFGAEYIEGLADSFKKNDKYFEVGVEKNNYKARTVIISTGASARRLNIEGEDKYFGRGVSTCATCDAALFRDKEVLVVGGGDSAMEESLVLYKFAKKITIVHRRDEFRASKIMQDRVLKLKDKINVVWDSIPTEVLGETLVNGIKIKNVKTNEESTIKCDGMFLAIGHNPNTKIFEKEIKLDKTGYIITGSRSKTNVEGVYAAGDCQDPIFRQAITSAGSGCKAAIEAERYIEHLKAKGEYK
ncbi:MAG: thioredoxin-disulfide reductase [Candidatus Nanoarchaeia archaeon]|jgi:thioredoxin reductase (NADPH)|nr:thioredoxin-disulfide reductase [Candidatus Nanoarchaeia archaeon]|tara:strand:+ start:2646 stop:3590 length:945 start_codon:yes stop_codon:yes gene_type:complete